MFFRRRSWLDFVGRIKPRDSRQWKVQTMINSYRLHQVLENGSEISGSDFCLYDSLGRIIAKTCEENLGVQSDMYAFAFSNADSCTISNCIYYKVTDLQKKNMIYILVQNIADRKNALVAGQLLVSHLEMLLNIYREPYEEENYIKELLLDDILSSEMLPKAVSLQIPWETLRIVFLLETIREYDFDLLDRFRQQYWWGRDDYVVALESKTIVVVKTMKADVKQQDIEQVAESMWSFLGEDNIKHIACGTTAKILPEISPSYKAAKIALEVGGLFQAEKRIFVYNKLSVPRFIFQCPSNASQLFLEETILGGRKTLEGIDEDMLKCIDVFLEKKLNVSETARELYVHRNTMVYRIRQIQRMTGLNLERFDDAVRFRLACLYLKQIKYFENMN